jgi:hypothetical protein
MNNTLLHAIFINFFNINLKYSNIIKKSKIQNDIDFDNKLKNKQVHLIGIFDKSLKIWFHAWCLDNYDIIGPRKKSRDILEHFILYNFADIYVNSIIKSIIYNPKIYITEYKTQLHFILAIFLYFSKINMYHIIIKTNRMIMKLMIINFNK